MGMNGEEAEAVENQSSYPDLLHPLLPQTMESREANKGFAKHKHTFWPTQNEGLLPRSTGNRSRQPKRVTFIEVAEVKIGK